MAKSSNPKRPQKIARGVRFDAATVKAVEALARERKVSFSRAVLIATAAGIQDLNADQASARKSVAVGGETGRAA